MSQQIKEAKKELSKLLEKGDNLTTSEIEDYFSRYRELSDNIELMKKEKMTSDIALLLVLAEQKGLS